MASATNSTVATKDGECDSEVQNFGQVTGSLAIEPEAHRSNKPRLGSSQIVSITPSSATGADRLQMELEKMESEAEKNE